MDEDEDGAGAEIEAGDAGDAVYQFEGFDIELNRLVALTPAEPRRGGG